jgi:hypothetical protein
MSQVPAPAPATGSRAATLGIYRAMKERDVEAFTALVHPAIEVVQPGFLPYGGTHRGVDGLLAMFREVLKLVDVRRLEIVSLVAEDDEVWAQFVVQTRVGGVDLSVAEHWTFEHGLARHLDVWFQDPTPLLSGAALR